jgi:hypothetical protein
MASVVFMAQRINPQVPLVKSFLSKNDKKFPLNETCGFQPVSNSALASWTAVAGGERGWHRFWNSRPESGVALRLPPHSKTASVFLASPRLCAFALNSNRLDNGKNRINLLADL